MNRRKSLPHINKKLRDSVGDYLFKAICKIHPKPKESAILTDMDGHLQIYKKLLGNSNEVFNRFNYGIGSTRVKMRNLLIETISLLYSRCYRELISMSQMYNVSMIYTELFSAFAYDKMFIIHKFQVKDDRMLLEYTIDQIDSIVRFFYDVHIPTLMGESLEQEELVKFQYHKLFIPADSKSNLDLTDYMYQPCYTLPIGVYHQGFDAMNGLLPCKMTDVLVVFPMLRKAAIFVLPATLDHRGRQIITFNSNYFDNIRITAPFSISYDQGSDISAALKDYYHGLLRNVNPRNTHSADDWCYNTIISNLNKIREPGEDPIGDTYITIAPTKTTHPISFLNLLHRLCIIFKNLKDQSNHCFYIELPGRMISLKKPSDLTGVIAQQLPDVNEDKVSLYNSNATAIYNSRILLKNTYKDVISDIVDKDPLITRLFRYSYNMYLKDSGLLWMNEICGREVSMELAMYLIPDIGVLLNKVHEKSIVLDLIFVPPFKFFDAINDRIIGNLRGYVYQYIWNRGIKYSIQFSDDTLDGITSSITKSIEMQMKNEARPRGGAKELANNIINNIDLSIDSIRKECLRLPFSNIKYDLSRKIVTIWIKFGTFFVHNLKHRPMFEQYRNLYRYICDAANGNEEYRRVKSEFNSLIKDKKKMRGEIIDEVSDAVDNITIHDAFSLSNFITQTNYYASSKYGTCPIIRDNM